MAGRYDITPLDTSTRNKLYAQMQQVGDQILSPQDIQNLMGQYGTMEDQGLRQAQDAATLELSQQYSPAFEALRARNYGLYGGGGMINRDYSNLMSKGIGDLTAQRMNLGSQSSARKAAYLRSLAEQRIAAKQGLGSQLYGRMMTTQKKPSFGQQALGVVGQLGGAAIGALAGGPMGGAGSQGGGLTGAGQFRPETVPYETAIASQQYGQLRPKFGGY
jgi:hypothetical protein